MNRFDLSTTPSTPWKNCGGSTRELACHPPGAGMDRFEWRISVATIAHSGPFSAFPGIARQIMLLSGDGVHLRGPAIDHALAQCWQPFAFDGAAAVDCTLLGGTSTDFNLMLRRGRWQGAIETVCNARHPGSTPAGLCMVLAGRWHWGDAALTAGQGCWWSAPEAGPALMPQAGQGGEAPVLAWVGLAPVFE
jgi:environmental stress-induced protein Ves